MASSLIGIDIGTNACRLAVHDDGIRLISRRLPDNLVANGQVNAPEALSEFMKELKASENIKLRDCVLVLNDEQSYFRHVTLPVMTEGELQLNLPYEFRDFIEGDPDDYTYDYVVDSVNTTEDDKPVSLELYAAAAAKEPVAQMQSILRKAGFRLRAVIPAPIAFANLLAARIATNPEEAEKSLVLVDFGYDSATMTLFHGALWQATRTIDFGINEFDSAIADLKGIDRYTAASYRTSNFEGVLDSPECQAVADRFCVEINKVINFYNFSNPNEDVKQIYLLGESANMELLTDDIRDSVSVEMGDIDELLPADARGKDYSATCLLAVAGLLEGEAM